MNAALRKGAIALALGFCIASAHADLARVGPANTPSPPGHGFPMWYQDLTGLVLDLCLPDANDPGALQQTACLLGPPNPPYLFPSNFPDEAFYYRGVSEPLAIGSAGQRAILVLALEAAFANGGVVAGDQMVFTRIRVTAGVPENGTYTVTHPFGVEIFPDVQATGGNRDITFTEDVGVVAGNFTDALHSRFGPFLQAATAPGGSAKAPVLLNGASFLSDGVALEFINGSPFNTNYFEICGKRADGADIPLGNAGTSGTCARTDLFTLTGRVHDSVANPIGSPLAIAKAFYFRDSTGSLVDVSANAVAGIGQAAPKLTVATVDLPPVLMTGPNALGQYGAQAIPAPLGSIPDSVTVTNSADVPPTSVVRHIVDDVRISQATYDRGTQRLRVTASTSDKGNGIAPAPALTLDGFPNACAPTVPGEALCEAVTAVPPPSVTVASAAGGQARADVSVDVSAGVASVFATANVDPGVPFTQDDAAGAVANGPAVNIPVLANDSSNAGAPLDPLTISVLAPGLTPNIGALTVNADGSVNFTPTAATGTATFKYTVSNAAGPSNVSTVTVDVTPPVGGPIPIAGDDGPFTMAVNNSIVIDILANDSGNGGTLDPASVTILTPPSVGNATVNATTGSITYVSGPTAGTVTFTYTVKDQVAANNPTPVASQPATVTINVVAPEQVAITRSQCVVKQGSWQVRGTTTVPAPNTVTLYTTATVPAVPAPDQILGTAAVDVTGAWQFAVKPVSCVTPISLQTSIGTRVENIPVQLK